MPEPVWFVPRSFRSILAAGGVALALAPVSSGFRGSAVGPIAFESNRTGSSDIFVTTLSGKPQLNLTPRSPATEAQPSWSPDGRRIAFSSDRKGHPLIWVMNADGSGQRALTKGKRADVGPAWSPDGKRIAFVSNDTGNWDLYYTTLSGRRVNLTHDKADEIDASWSPKGDQIVYDGIANGTSDLWIRSVSGGNPRQLTRTPKVAELNPALSPDGNEIAYDAADARGNYDIYVLDLKTREIRRVTSDEADDGDPAWSPDGKRIVFRRAVREDYEIALVNADGSGLRNLTKSPRAQDLSPAWQPVKPLGQVRLPSGAAMTAANLVFACDPAWPGKPWGETLTGDGAVNHMCGDGGNDNIKGAGNGDYLSGGEGSDVLRGDRVLVAADDGADWIKARPDGCTRDYVYGGGKSDHAYVDACDWVAGDVEYRLY